MNHTSTHNPKKLFQPKIEHRKKLIQATSSTHVFSIYQRLFRIIPDGHSKTPIVILFPLQVFLFLFVAVYYTRFAHSKKKTFISISILQSAFHMIGEWFYYYFHIYIPVVRLRSRFRHLRFRCRRGGVVPFIPAALAFIYSQKFWIKAFDAANIVTVKFWDFLLKHRSIEINGKHHNPFSHTQTKFIPNFSFHFELSSCTCYSLLEKCAWTLLNQKIGQKNKTSKKENHLSVLHRTFLSNCVFQSNI